MDFKNDLKNGVRLATDAATDIAQSLVEKSRLRASANRIKQVIKGDTELRNQAYIELGRYFYENLRENAPAEQEALCVVVDKTSLRIHKASKKYFELLSERDDIKLSGENADKIKQLVTDKAEKIKDTTNDKVTKLKDVAKETSQKAKDKAVDLSDKAKSATQDIHSKAKLAMADLGDKAKEKIDDFKSFVAPQEDLDDIINSDDDLEEMIAKEQEMIENASVNPTLDIDDEESPEEFEF